MVEKNKSSKNFMTLSKKECLVVYQQILLNADSHYNNALVLAENKSYGSAMSFLILSMEETMKAFVLYMDGSGFQFRQNVKGIDNLFNNHQLRYPLAMFLSILHIFIQDLKALFHRIRSNPDEILELEKRQEELKPKVMGYLINKLQIIILEVAWFSNAEIYRQDGFYVDYSDGLKSPLSANENQFNDVKLRIDSLREFNKSFFGVFEFNDLGFQKQVKKIQKQFIEKDLYSKMGNSIEGFKKRKAGSFMEISTELNDLLKKLQNPEEMTDEEEEIKS